MKAHLSRRVFLAGGVIIVLLALSPVIASASLYGIQNYASAKTLYRIDPNNGSYAIVSNNCIENIGGLAYNGSCDGHIYVMQNYASVVPFPKTLYRINPNNGSYTIVSSNCVEKIGGLAYNSSDGYLYGMQNYASTVPFPKTLYCIDPSNGSSTIVSSNCVENIGGLAYNSSDGYLYGMQNYASTVPFPKTLYRINPSNGSYVIVSDNCVENIGGLAYNSSDGYLYGMQNYATIVPFPKTLYRIDPSNGSYVIVSDNCVENIGGLAYVPEPPEKPLESELAISVIGGPYLGDGVFWGGKGFNCRRCPPTRFVEPHEIKTSGYCYYDARIDDCNQSAAPGVDCSGLIFWAYNKAFGAVTYQETEAPYNIIHYENADGQYLLNSTPIAESDLMPGDLLFFNTNNDTKIEHVEMYVGAFFYPGGSIKGTYYPAGLYDIVSARGNIFGIIPDCLSKRAQPENGFVGFGRVTPLPWVAGTVVVQSPVDIILTDPDGFTITKDIWEVPGVLYYSVFDIDQDGDLDDMVTIVERKIGDYLITVFPEPDASPTDTYTLGVNFDGQTLILAENVLISYIPDEPYLIRSTETEIIPIIPATIDFDPDTMNLKSKAQWITCYIWLPEDYEVGDIDPNSILLEDEIEAELFWVDEEEQVTIVRFSRSDVQGIEPGEVELTVRGELTDGTGFEGGDTIRVIDKGGKK